MVDFQVGYDAWKGCSDASYKAEKDIRAFEESVHWDDITSFCRKSRNVLCSIGPKFVVGSKNLVKIVEFADGVKWVVKLPLPHPDIYRMDGNATNRLAALRSEVATLKFLRTNTAIPVPEVYAFDDGVLGQIGASCILMEYIHGTPADALFEGGKDAFGDPQQDEYILKQLANIHVQLAQVKFYGIGSLYESESDGRYFVGPETETGTGPFSAPDEYYEALCKHRQALYGNGILGDISDVHGPDTTLPQMFLDCMPTFCKMQHEGPFSLANTNFGGHSILIDSNFKVISMIDCSGIIAGPFHMGAQFPQISPIDDLIPGERPLIDQHSSKAIMRRRSYIDFLWQEGQGVGLHRKTVATGLAQAMVSDAAQFVRALQEFRMRSWERNSRWIHSFTFMYERACAYRLLEDAEQAEDEDDVPHTDGPVSREEDPGFVEGPLTPVMPTSLPVRTKTAEQNQEPGQVTEREAGKTSS
ncbi:MAG: hypothetical protein M1813_005794 [Trichoglossum hirsutum]|nr:MAG: hypothetical protein M1813_005794 [Trichoglossum hirsutum]